MHRDGALVRARASIQPVDLDEGDKGVVWSLFEPDQCWFEQKAHEGAPAPARGPPAWEHAPEPVSDWDLDVVIIEQEELR